MRARYWLVSLGAIAAYAGSDQQKTIDADVARWRALTGNRPPPGVAGVAWLFARMPEFRSLLAYRLRAGNRPAYLVCRIWMSVFGGQGALLLMADEIGPGLFLQHAFATIVLAKRIGRDCWINQQVTIGHTNFENDSKPTLGDRVTVFAGAKVIGNITVGNDAVIGANAVVRHDVPPRAVVAGVPARVIWLDGKRVDLALSELDEQGLSAEGLGN